MKKVDSSTETGLADIAKGVASCIPTAAIAKATFEADPSAFKPAAGELGKTAYGITRSINIALTPIRLVVWGYDQVEAYIIENLGKKLEFRKVPAERITQPDPDVAVPALQALGYSKLREQYINLLATSMDSATAALAHPAFVEVLKQLSPDEARIIGYALQPFGYRPVMDLGVDSDAVRRLLARNVSALGRAAGCIQDNVSHYLDNICRLGIARVEEGALSEDEHYMEVRRTGTYQFMFNEIKQLSGAKFVEVLKTISMTNFGRNFRKACLTETTDSV